MEGEVEHQADRQVVVERIAEHHQDDDAEEAEQEDAQELLRPQEEEHHQGIEGEEDVEGTEELIRILICWPIPIPNDEEYQRKEKQHHHIG